MYSTLTILDHKKTIAKRFNAAAKNYDQSAILQQTIGNLLIERLSLIKINPSFILDLGSGTGFHAQSLKNLYPQATLCQFDIAEQMLLFSKENYPSSPFYCCGDGETLPLQDNSVDFVFSNCFLFWLSDPLQVFSEVKRILKLGGLFLFSSFGPDTLIELRQTLKKIGANEVLPNFTDLHIIGDMLLQSRFHDPVMDREMFTLTYHSAIGLIRDLKNTGAISAHKTPSTYLLALARTYQSFQQDNQCPATFEVVYGHAWKE